MRIPILAVVLSALPVAAQDTNCPAYPQAERTELNRSLELDQLAAQYSAGVRRAKAGRIANAATRVNFVDNYIFDKMDQDRVVAAPQTSDEEFVRRVYIDLTGRIPTPDQARQFLQNDTRPDKRARLIEELLGSSAYIDQWTLFFANRFQVTSGYYNYIGLQGRNLFHRFLQDFIRQDRSYKDVVTEMLTASGDADASGPANFLIRAWQDGDPMQDTWDTATDRTTTRILGLKTECISCHDGRGHLEQINLYMSQRRRREFWGMSAFFSRTTYQRLNVDGFGQRARFFLVDRPSGAYSSSVDANNPGPRPVRNGGPYTPQWIFSGEQPKSGEWRKEFARILTNDRQFARATVNYLWAAMFSYGLVDPADGWDLARVDPSKPPKDWPMQLTHPELLDNLAEYFVASNYSVKEVLRLIANSSAYQLSSRYDGQWRPEFTRYFAKHQPRRLAAEEMWDAISIATDTVTPMEVFGFDKPLLYANQLPDPTEPRSSGTIVNFMNLFGRGDWWTIGRTSDPSLLQLLFTMNDSAVVSRTFPANWVSNRVAKVALSNASDTAAIQELFLSTLSRMPTSDEVATVLARKKGTRLDWLADLQWALLNKLDFIFNY